MSSDRMDFHLTQKKHQLNIQREAVVYHLEGILLYLKNPGKPLDLETIQQVNERLHGVSRFMTHMIRDASAIDTMEYLTEED